MSFSIWAGTNEPDYGKQSKKAEEQRQAAIRKGTGQINQAFAGFTPTFYQQRASAYTDFALPQLYEQYRTNRDQLNYGMANKGLLGSSTAQEQGSRLNRAAEEQRRGVLDYGQAQAQDLQKSVLATKSQLLGQLYQSADPAQGAQSAIAAASSFQAPSAFTPIANLFGQWANQYYTSQLLNAYRTPQTTVLSPPASTYQPGSPAPAPSISTLS